MVNQAKSDGQRGDFQMGSSNELLLVVLGAELGERYLNQSCYIEVVKVEELFYKKNFHRW